MDNDTGDDSIAITLDSDQEHPSLDELETSQVGIVDRLRQLQAVTARANQRQRWRRFKNNPDLTYMLVEKGPVNNNGSSSGEERVRNCKRDTSHLAKALEMDFDGKKTDKWDFFNCNICLVMAKDPVLTCCGHLFCSSCFDRVPYVDSISKECPTCEGEVANSNITVVYGNGKNARWF